MYIYVCTQTHTHTHTKYLTAKKESLNLAQFFDIL